MTAASVRYFAVAVAALALLATYAFARRLFRSEAIALAAIVILAVEPGMVFYARADQGQTVFMMLAKAVAIWLLLRWWDTLQHLVAGARHVRARRRAVRQVHLHLGDLGLALATAVVAGRAVWQLLTLRTALIGAGAFLAGCLPLILDELRSGFGTLGGYSDIAEPLPGSGGVHFDERAAPSGGVVNEFGQRLRVLGDLIDGSTVSRLIDSPFPRHFEVVPLLVVLAAVALCAQLVVRRPPSRELRAGAFALLATLFILIAATASGLGFHGHHVILAYPFPHLGTRAGRGSDRSPARPPRRPRAAPCRGRRVRRRPGSGSHHRQRDQHGGDARWPARRQRPRLWSDEIYDVVPYLEHDRPGLLVVGADWGVGYLVVGLSQGHVKVADLAFDLQASPAAPTRRVLSRRLRDRRTLYVLRAPRTTTYRRARRRFFALARELGYQPALVRRFSDAEAGPQFEVYSAARLPG